MRSRYRPSAWAISKARWGRRRSYRLCWNPAEARLRRDEDGGQLRALEPDLYGKVLAFMLATYTRDWLLTEGLVEEYEIEPEIARLADVQAARLERSRRNRSER